MNPIIIAIIQVTLFLILPYYLVKLSKALHIEKILGGVIVCYFVGIVFANTKALYITDETTLEHIEELSKLTSEMSVVFAIPMLLMTCSMLDWLKYTGKITLSFGLCALSVLLMAMVMIYFFNTDAHLGKDAAVSVGMLSATFIGGTPNMAAIGATLDPSNNLFPVLNATDMFATGIYFLFLTSFAPIVFGWFLPKFKSTQKEEDTDSKLITNAEQEKKADYHFQWNWASIRPILMGLFVAVVVLGLSVGLGMLFPTTDGKMNNALVMLGLTTFGVVASFFTVVRNLKGVYEFAQYLLLVFAIAAGSMADFSAILEQGTSFILLTIFFLLSVIILHLIFCIILRIDRDTYLITFTASIFGPPFIGQMVQVLKNKEILAAGMAVASLGLALGNYIGILVAKIGVFI
ncbi:MAG: DUF819 family protein [Saprospiraceae bacterium]|nr:DUF819 family protein [Saprospiraceae bacterium]